MPHQDTPVPTASAPHHQDLKAVLDALLRHADLSNIQALSQEGVIGAWSG